MNGPIRVAIAGLGNCAASLIEGIAYYRQNPADRKGLLFPVLGSYDVADIQVVCAFDISSVKVGKPVREGIYQFPNNFVRIPEVVVDGDAPVLRGPTLDGNPDHLRRFVQESDQDPVDVPEALQESGVEILVNLLPTGSLEATEFYAQAALQAGCAFINCIPSVLAQREDMQSQFSQKKLPLIGDDVKSQVGTTILHRAILHMFGLRGADLIKSSQVNIGGNTDFANFIYRAESKLISKRKSLARYTTKAESHVGHHYDPTRGPLKTALIDLEARVFGGSPVRISVRLESDDKPNSAGTVVDLIRIARLALDRGVGGVIPEACAFYMKSPPAEMEDEEAWRQVCKLWAGETI